MFLIPGWVIAVLTFPGVIIHEFAHKIACDLTGVHVYRVCYFRIGNPAGYVEHAPPKTYKQAFVISTAPFIVNSAIAVAIFAIAVKTPSTIKIFGIEFKYILYWLGISIAMHAFPSSHDAKNVWDFTWKVWRRNPLVILGIPVVVLIYIANALSYFWFDAIYALILLTLTVSVIKAPTTDTITSFAKDISESVISLANGVTKGLETSLGISNVGISLDFLYHNIPLATFVVVIAIIFAIKSKRRGIPTRKRYRIKEISEVGEYYPPPPDVTTYDTTYHLNETTETKEHESLYAKCAFCGKTVYLPYKCNYCGQYYCDDHRLPFNHNCPGIDSYKDSPQPKGGIWKYRRY